MEFDSSHFEIRISMGKKHEVKRNIYFQTTAKTKI